MRIPYSTIVYVSIACLVFAVFLIGVYIFVPILMGEKDLLYPSQTTAMVQGISGLASMLSIILSGFLIGLLPLLAVVEILTSKSDNNFKLTWIGIIFALPVAVSLLIPLLGFIVGLVCFGAYYFNGRKELS